MLPARVRSICTVISLIFLSSGCADATPAGSLAARAVAEAKSMPDGRERDVVLREISRNLRHADRDHAIQAAAAMSEDYELRTFRSGPDRLTHQVLPQQGEQNSKRHACERFIEGLKPRSAIAGYERRIRDCFSIGAPPGIVPASIPPFRLILIAADALPPGPTKAQLLYMATWRRVPERPAGGTADAVRRLRRLVPLLDGDTQRRVTEQLDTIEVDLIEGRPDDAIARVRQAFAKKQADGEMISPEPAAQAQGLIADFLKARDLDRAMTVTNLLTPSSECTMVDDGLTGVTEWVLPTQDSTAVAAYITRLQASGSLARLCPKGLGDEIAADVWLHAGEDGKAIDAATRSGNPLVLGKTRLSIIERRMQAGDAAGTRSTLQTAAAAVPALDTGNLSDRNAAARQRLQLIHFLAKVGDTENAERLATGYPGPAWRSFAYSVIVATINRDRAGPNWGGPFLDIQEVSTKH
ncbi:hypothetical protein GCM10022268_30750 [Sphingomonas cynarae]|uniref:Uncharacterized protein n=1 Tax=Sphingomonas cynarae TaxID=930197 RepID=A0ABP7EM82_9SPHN